MLQNNSGCPDSSEMGGLQQQCLRSTSSRVLVSRCGGGSRWPCVDGRWWMDFTYCCHTEMPLTRPVTSLSAALHRRPTARPSARAGTAARHAGAILSAQSPTNHSCSAHRVGGASRHPPQPPFVFTPAPPWCAGPHAPPVQAWTRRRAVAVNAVGSALSNVPAAVRLGRSGCAFLQFAKRSRRAASFVRLRFASASSSSSSESDTQQELQFSLLRIAGDGRCLFRSLAQGGHLATAADAAKRPQLLPLAAETARADELRQEVCDELLKRRWAAGWCRGGADAYLELLVWKR